MNKITSIIGCVFCIAFLIGLATTLTRSMMIGFTDVLPAELFVGNRGGITKTGSKVYSPTDSGGEKVLKSLRYIK